MTLSGGRSRMTSARARSASISTRKPSRLASRASANVIAAVLMRRSPAGCERAAAFRSILTGDELAPEQFSDRRFGKFVDELVAARALETGESRSAAELIEFVRLHRA